MVLLGVGAGCSSKEAPGTNLLLITLDTTRADRLGAYGYSAGSTPHLDALARVGVTFEEAHSSAPMTLPAHATMFTGLLPPEHGARVNGVHKLAEGVPTLAEWLGEAGYRNGAFVAAFVLDERFGLGRGFDHYDDDLSAAYEQEMPEGLSSYRAGETVVDAALAWLDEGQGPFFAWVHLYDAHFPWHAHGASGEEGEGASETGTYDGELSYVDAQVGRLLDYLDQRGLRASTLVMAVADHGEGLGDHQEVEHAYLLNHEVLHVPWIVAGPGVKAGHRVAALVSLEDLLPTALDQLGLLPKRMGGTRGRSLRAALRGEALPSGVAYAETELPWTSYRWAPQYSLTTEEWKYVRTPQVELYDRKRDLGELANLAATKPERVRELEAQLRAMELDFTVRESEVATLSSAENEQLAALGYASGSLEELPEDRSVLADVKQRFEARGLFGDLRLGVVRGTLQPAARIQAAQRLVELSPESPAFHNELAQSYAEVGEYALAVPIFERVAEMSPGDAGVHYALGDSLQQAGHTAKARKHLELALSLQPEMAAAHVGLGNVLRSEGRSDLAAGEYSEALRLQPDYPEAYYNLAQSLLDRGLVQPALEKFSMALEQRPDWGLAHSRLAYLRMSLGEPSVARAHFEAALAESPGDVDLCTDLGVALERLGLLDEARAQYQKARELAPKYFRPRLNLGNLDFGLGRDDEALAQYEAAFALAPQHPEVAARLARFLALTPAQDQGQGQRALQLAQHAIEANQGGSAALLDTLALVLASQGEFSRAMATCKQAQRLAAAAGEQLLLAELQERWALYAMGKPYVLERAPVPQTQGQ